MSTFGHDAVLSITDLNELAQIANLSQFVLLSHLTIPFGHPSTVNRIPALI